MYVSLTVRDLRVNSIGSTLPDNLGTSIEDFKIGFNSMHGPVPQSIELLNLYNCDLTDSGLCKPIGKVFKYDCVNNLPGVLELTKRMYRGNHDDQ